MVKAQYFKCRGVYMHGFQTRCRNHQSQASSRVHPSVVGQWVLRGNCGGTMGITQLQITWIAVHIASLRYQKLHCIHDFERSRNQRQGSESFLGNVCRKKMYVQVHETRLDLLGIFLHALKCILVHRKCHMTIDAWKKWASYFLDHLRNTRSDLKLPLKKTNSGQSGFVFRGAKAWDGLSLCYCVAYSISSVAEARDGALSCF